MVAAVRTGLMAVPRGDAAEGGVPGPDGPLGLALPGGASRTGPDAAGGPVPPLRGSRSLTIRGLQMR